MPTIAPDAGAALGPRHHALLFACCAGEVLAMAGEDRGRGLVGAIVRRYGEERGRRMALRAIAAGHPRDMTHYLAYGEWRAEPGAHDPRWLQTPEGAHLCVWRCPWEAAWRADGSLGLGRLYCEEIDVALVRGFSPALRLDTRQLLTAGAPCCEFLFHEADLGRTVTVPAHMAPVMPWGYHLGHLYWTAWRVMRAAGPERGANALRAALAQFGERCGTGAVAAILAHETTDFTRLPTTPAPF